MKLGSYHSPRWRIGRGKRAVSITLRWRSLYVVAFLVPLDTCSSKKTINTLSHHAPTGFLPRATYQKFISPIPLTPTTELNFANRPSPSDISVNLNRCRCWASSSTVICLRIPSRNSSFDFPAVLPQGYEVEFEYVAFCADTSGSIYAASRPRAKYRAML